MQLVHTKTEIIQGLCNNLKAGLWEILTTYILRYQNGLQPVPQQGWRSIPCQG